MTFYQEGSDGLIVQHAPLLLALLDEAPCLLQHRERRVLKGSPEPIELGEVSGGPGEPLSIHAVGHEDPLWGSRTVPTGFLGYVPTFKYRLRGYQISLGPHHLEGHVGKFSVMLEKEP